MKINRLSESSCFSKSLDVMTNSYVNQINQSKLIDCMLNNISAHEVNHKTSTKHTNLSLEYEL